jgi:hypothetical protein
MKYFYLIYLNCYIGKLPLEGIVMILEDLAKTGNAEPLDKQKHR